LSLRIGSLAKAELDVAKSMATERNGNKRFMKLVLRLDWVKGYCIRAKRTA
jgi:hypothetical protein